MTKAQLKIVAELLEIAADIFHNHGCNDYEIENTPENLEFVKQMIAADSDEDEPDEELEISEDGELIYLHDAMTMQYLSDLLKKESE